MSKGTKFQNGLSTSKAYAEQTTTLPGARNQAVANGITKTAVIHVPAGATANTNTNSEFVLPTNCIVKNVYLYVGTADTTETIDVGTDGISTSDPNGYIAGASLSAAGLVIPAITSGAVTRGALLVNTATAASTSATTMKWDAASGGATITWTTSDGTDTFDGDIIIEYVEFDVSRPLSSK